MLLLQGITYIHSNKDLLFSNLDLKINRQDKTALVGNNGAGKSTLLKIMAGELMPASGQVKTNSRPYYVPQQLGQYNDSTIAEALGVDNKLQALHQILNGALSAEHLEVLNDDWDIEQRCKEALQHWHLHDVNLSDSMSGLSGGQKTRVFLAGITIHNPDLVLLDEPSNNLDEAGRQLLYDYVISTNQSLVVVSHDRKLLNLLHSTIELNKAEIKAYGGNYEFYAEQKLVEAESLERQVKEKEKTLRKAKDTERTAMARQQKLDARGKKKQEKAGLPTIMMNTLKNNAEKSTARMKDVQAEKVDGIFRELLLLRQELPDIDKMKMGFDTTNLHKGKVLATAQELNFGYATKTLWSDNLNFQLLSGDRLAIKGYNGSGKSTLLKILLGELEPTQGTIEKANIQTAYLDQDYSLVRLELSVYEQALAFNNDGLEEHEIKTRLSRYLFTTRHWNMTCSKLSGGEKMRLALCCLSLSKQGPDLIVLDEPTNNLDLQNIKILTAAIRDYQGTLVVVSHDSMFLNEIGIERSMDLSHR